MPLSRELVWVKETNSDLWHVVNRMDGQLRTRALCNAHDLLTSVVLLKDPLNPAHRCAVCELLRTPGR